jgi:hypothetical protein
MQDRELADAGAVAAVAVVGEGASKPSRRRLLQPRSKDRLL